MSCDTPKPSSVAFPASATRATVWSICSHVDPDDEDGASNTTPAASLMHVLEVSPTAVDSWADVATDATWLQLPEEQPQPNRASTPEQRLDDQGGGGGSSGGEGGGAGARPGGCGGSCGGCGGSCGGGGGCTRVPQSTQSVPQAQESYCEPGPPSSQ